MVLQGAVPGIHKSGSDLGSHTQSTTASAKCTPSGTTSLHHVADSHDGISIVVVTMSCCSYRHTMSTIM